MQHRFMLSIFVCSLFANHVCIADEGGQKLHDQMPHESTIQATLRRYWKPVAAVGAACGAWFGLSRERGGRASARKIIPMPYPKGVPVERMFDRTPVQQREDCSPVIPAQKPGTGSVSSERKKDLDQPSATPGDDLSQNDAVDPLPGVRGQNHLQGGSAPQELHNSGDQNFLKKWKEYQARLCARNKDKEQLDSAQKLSSPSPSPAMQNRDSAQEQMRKRSGLGSNVLLSAALSLPAGSLDKQSQSNGCSSSDPMEATIRSGVERDSSLRLGFSGYAADQVFNEKKSRQSKPKKREMPIVDGASEKSSVVIKVVGTDELIGLEETEEIFFPGGSLSSAISVYRCRNNPNDKRWWVLSNTDGAHFQCYPPGVSVPLIGKIIPEQ